MGTSRYVDFWGLDDGQHEWGLRGAVPSNSEPVLPPGGSSLGNSAVAASSGATGLNQWDKLVVDGPSGRQEVPGLVQVDFVRHVKLDKKSPLGRNGATLTAQGFDAPDIKILLTMWTAEQNRQWQDMLAILHPNGVKLIPAIGCYHPALSMHGITAAYPWKIGPPVPQKGEQKGVALVHMTWLQFLPPEKGQTDTSLRNLNMSDIPHAVKPLALAKDPTAPPSRSGAANDPNGASPSWSLPARR